ncbi:MAG: NAD-dependent epimerase/dehydratase family protein [Bacteroidota bacterium]|nr:NAD-dependent epimerase/dehydratase family protein [Bacteroidota bacterium]
MQHTILGAGGAIGNALTDELLKAHETIRLVSRRNYSRPGTESQKADLTSYEETLNSVKGSDIVYLCAGVPYNAKVWSESWPRIMQNTIDACKSSNARLIFFDNVYMYGRVNGKMTENTPYNPCSKKGEVRAKIATLLEDEIRHKNINSILARSADFYGPYATIASIPYIMVFDRLTQGKSAQWLVDAHKTHSFTYTLDCAKALNLLAKSNEAFNQTWHLPTCNPAIDGKKFIELAAKIIDVPPKYTVMPKWMVNIMGHFDKTIHEIKEMLYQNEFEYYFDSSKFNDYFAFEPTTYEKGILETIEFLKKK